MMFDMKEGSANAIPEKMKYCYSSYMPQGGGNSKIHWYSDV